MWYISRSTAALSSNRQKKIQEYVNLLNFQGVEHKADTAQRYRKNTRRATHTRTQISECEAHRGYIATDANEIHCKGV